MALLMVGWVGGLGYGALSLFDQVQNLSGAGHVEGPDAAELPSDPALPSVVARLPAVPVPTALPVVRRPGKDVFGYTRDYADRAGFAALARASRFAELTGYFELLAKEVAGDFRKERLMIEALSSFGSADPRLGPALGAWVQANPGSFAAFAARGEHRKATAWYFRGNAYAAETSAARMDAMRRWARLADEDLSRAAELAPDVTAVHNARIDVGMLLDGGRARRDAALEAGLRTCPACFFIRRTYLGGLEPRWGGSYKEMEGFAVEAQVHAKDNARLAVLLGRADAERCYTYLLKDKLAAALDACDAALRAGESSLVRRYRGQILRDQERYEEALVEFGRALDLEPTSTAARVRRGWVHMKLGQTDAARRDFETVLFVTPLNDRAVSYLEHLTRKARQGPMQDYKAGRYREAIAGYDRVLADNPRDVDALLWRGMARSKAGDGDGAIRDLEMATRSDPSRYDAFITLDYELARKRRFSDIVEHWDRYLTEKPDDARAYLERGGARLHAGDVDGAIADMGKACEMGLEKGCQGREYARARRK